jgi:Domain of unknown function (DUF6894)
MPRFYFDIRNPRLTIKDDERMELPDLDTACKEATVAAAEMIKDQVPCDYAEIALGTRGTGLRGHFGGAGDKAVGPRALSLGRPFTRGPPLRSRCRRTANAHHPQAREGLDYGRPHVAKPPRHFGRASTSIGER